MEAPEKNHARKTWANASQQSQDAFENNSAATKMMSSSEKCAKDKSNHLDALSNTKELDLKQLEATDDADENPLHSAQSSHTLQRPCHTAPADQMMKMEESRTHAIVQIEGIFKENEASEEAGSLNLKK